jgi:PhzF family phenazine biosynthesis protein
MILSFFQIDAFSSVPFSGNPAAVYPLQHWLPDTQLQAIAMEHQLAETAFFVPSGSAYELRWFSPETEVDLCGHATLAAAHVLYNELGVKRELLQFYTRSGTLTVQQTADGLMMDFPLIPIEKFTGNQQALTAALGLEQPPVSIWQADDILVELSSQFQVAELEPNMQALAQIPTRGVIVTALSASSDTDFISRFFGPRVGVNEDAVTGSAHTKLAPFWAEKLGKTTFKAKQISKRGGQLSLEIKGERVFITGQAVRFSRGESTLPNA